MARKQPSVKAHAKAKLVATRKCSLARWNVLSKQLSEGDKIVVRYRPLTKSVFCNSCVGTVKDDNLLSHVVSDKHVKKVAQTHASRKYQQDLSKLISTSRNFTQIDSEIHVYRSKLLRVIYATGVPLNRFCKTVSSLSFNYTALSHLNIGRAVLFFS